MSQINQKQMFDYAKHVDVAVAGSDDAVVVAVADVVVAALLAITGAVVGKYVYPFDVVVIS